MKLVDSRLERTASRVSDFPALALGQKPAQASHQKPDHARATTWLRVAYGLGFQFGKPFTWALALAPVLGGHGPRQTNSREPAVNFFSLFVSIFFSNQ